MKNFSVVILVDSGNTHNFIDEKVVKMGGFHTQSVNGISVSIANGDKMCVKDLCVVYSGSQVKSIIG